MDATRIKRLIIVALLGIALVLAITIVSERGRRAQENKGSELAALEAHERPPDPTQTTDPGTVETRDPSRILGRGGRAVIDVTDPKTGRLVRRVSYGEMEPLAEGVFEVKNPEATFFVTPRRVIQLRSNEGRLEAPGNVPQSGTLRGNLVITLFESRTAEPADLSPQSPDRMVTIEVADEAKFNTTLGEIRTESDIVVYTPVTEQVRFEGTGLNLVFNEPEQRIEYLEVLRGKSLRYRPGAGDLTLEQTRPEPGKPADAKVDAKKPDEKPEPVQHYRVTFERQVLAKIGGRSIDADTLVAYLGLTRSDAPGGKSGAKEQPGVAPQNAPPVADATKPAPAADAAADATKAQAKEDKPVEEVVLTWSGKLVMVPMDGPHERMAHARDTFVTFTGKPLIVAMEGGERLVCRTLEYLQSTGDVEAVGTAAYPLRIAAPSLGTVESERLAMALGGDTARLVGAGSIRANEVEAETQPEAKPGEDAKKDDEKKRQPRGLPSGFRASWTEGVDLKFAESAKPASGIESADFRGRVRIDDERFKLRADQLVTHFAAPPAPAPPAPAPPAPVAPANDATKPADTDAKKRPRREPTDRQLAAIDAVGKVNVTFSDGTIKAGKLRLDTQPNEKGKLVPSLLTAQQDAVVNNPQQRLAAQMLTVTLAEAKPKPKPQKKPGDKAPANGATDGAAPAAPVREPAVAVGDHDSPVGQRIQDGLAVDVRTIVAIDAVELVDHAVGRRVRAERLDADNTSGQARLIGSPVVVTEHERLDPDGVAPEGSRPEWELHVLNVTIHDNGETLTTEGPGKFIYTQYPDEKAGDKKPGDKPAVDGETDSDAKAKPDADIDVNANANGNAAGNLEAEAEADKQLNANKPDQPTAPRRVKVSWTDRMRYEHEANRLDVFGNVVAEAEDSPTELNSLSASSMTLELVDPDIEKKVLGGADAAKPGVAAAPGAVADPNAPTAPVPDPGVAPTPAILAVNADVKPADAAAPVDAQFDQRMLRKLTARGDVVLRAVRYTDATRDAALTRLRISGPILEFTNVTKTAQVIGPGSMLIEDYRPTGKPDDKTQAAPMSGRGQSLFTWRRDMTLDGEKADMILRGDVNMTHKPLDRSELMEMRCDQLIADMKAAGQFDPTGMTKVESMDIDHIRADGAVQLRDPSQSKIASTADHLHYDGQRKIVDLLADPNGRVTIYRLDQAKPLKGKAFRWNLAEDSFEVIDPGF